MAVSVDDLGKEIIKELNRYTYEVEQKVADIVVDTGKQSAKELRATTQVNGSNGKPSKVWNEYPRGWTTKNKKTRGKQISEVHNKEHYRLTHLLENGHVIKNGTGRTYGNTAKFVHIKPVEEKAVKEIEERIVKAIEG